MADVTERAQLILVMGFVLSVAFVVLALLLNTVIFTENLASRGTELGGREAIEYQSAVTEGVGRLVDEENQREHRSHSAVGANITAGIEAMDVAIRLRYGETAVVADVNESTITLHDGELVRQLNASRTFTDSSGSLDDWTMLEDTNGVRQFSMSVDRVNLTETTESGAEMDAFAVSTNETTGGDEWQVFIYENASTNNISVAVQVGGGAVSQLCSIDQASATLDLTAGTIAGQPCNGFKWAEGIDGEYDLKFINGRSAIGTYNLTVNTSGGGTVNSSTVNDGTTSSDSPYHVPAVYSVTFDIVYESPDIVFRGTLRIARGEPT